MGVHQTDACSPSGVQKDAFGLGNVFLHAKTHRERGGSVTWAFLIGTSLTGISVTGKRPSG